MLLYIRHSLTVRAALAEEGIFRVPGTAEDVKRVKATYDSGMSRATQLWTGIAALLHAIVWGPGLEDRLGACTHRAVVLIVEQLAHAIFLRTVRILWLVF